MSEFHSSSLPESSKHVVVADMMPSHIAGGGLVSVIPPLAGAGRGGGRTWRDVAAGKILPGVIVSRVKVLTGRPVHSGYSPQTLNALQGEG